MKNYNNFYLRKLFEVNLKKTKSFYLHNRVIVQRGLGVSVLLGICYQVISSYVSFLPYITLSKFHILIILFIELWVLSTLLNIYFRYERQNPLSFRKKLAYWFSLFNLVVLYLLFRFYNNLERLQYSSAQLALKLIIFSIILFALIFNSSIYLYSFTIF